MDIKKALTKILIFLLIFTITFLPRFIGIGSDMANFDSQYWMPRTTEFTKAVLDKDWEQTYQQYHPGTTLLWTSGFSKLFYERYFEFKHGFNPRYIPQHFSDVNFWAILPLVIMISILLTISTYKIKNLLGMKTAIFFLLFITFEPFFLGVSRFLHLTALSTMFGFSSFLFFINYLLKKQKRDLIFSSILIALGITTKISLVIMFPVFGIASVYYILKTNDDSKIYKKILRIIIYNLIPVLTTIILFFIVNPFMWVAPLFYLQRIYSDGILNTGFGDSGQDTLFNNNYLFYLEYSLYRLMPITFLLFIIGVIFYLKNFGPNAKQNISYFFIYVIIYYLFLSIPSKLMDRYLVELIPPMLLISSYGLVSIYHYKKNICFIIFGVFIFVTFFNIYRYHPLYSYYHSDLILGPAGLYKIGINPRNNGEYYATIAKYLNFRDPKPSEKTVLISNPRAIYSFSPFYIGKTFTSIGNMDKNRKVNYVIARSEDYSKYNNICNFEKAFGPKDPLGQEVLFLFDCNMIGKEEFKELILK